MYEDDELLMLSGIQHFSFCQRQWALIHIEQQWEENPLTYEGSKIHEKVDDPFLLESRGELKISRGMPIVSRRLGLNGIADVVEFRKSETGVLLEGHAGRWSPNVVEYKHGKPKQEQCDVLQLCAQAICLEEMLHTHIEQGDLYYWKIRKRETIKFDQKLRDETQEIADMMHACFEQGTTKRAAYQSYCESCSLKQICLPKMAIKPEGVRGYLQKSLNMLEET